MVPPFVVETGYLPVGEHDAEWTEFIERFGWNASRKRLISGLRRMALNLRGAGCGMMIMDGSFVTNVPAPSDYDACCDFTGMDALMIDLRLLGPKAVMKAHYLGELRPEQWLADGELTFRKFYQTDRDDRPKGVVRLQLGGVE